MSNALARARRLLWAWVFLSAVLLRGSALADESVLRTDPESGAGITPEFAQSLYEQLSPMRESDGCTLARFDTKRSFIIVGLSDRSGDDHALQIAAASSGAGDGRRAGNWVLAVPSELERACEATLVAIERVLAETATPEDAPWRADRWTSVRANYSVLAASFVVLVLWTARILYREARAQSATWPYMTALATVWALALVLRLAISPHTFLHEYYHAAETLTGYLMGDTGPVYGDTGPALFQLTGMMLGRPEDPSIIFLTNALLASLAIPAVALLDLAVARSWPRAIGAAVFLCVLPHHLRFSASEVLFVQAVTFGMWALGLFALYVRTRHLEDVLCGALAMSLAMQTRPEMLFVPALVVALTLLTEPRSWRVLFDWRTFLALLVLGILLIPRFFELRQVLSSGSSPPPNVPDLRRYANGLVVLQGQVMPPIYRPLLVLGTLWSLWRKPGLLVWVTLVFVGFSLFSLSLFDNGPYNVRTQLLPTCFLVLIAAGAVSLWMAVWGRHRRLALGLGASALVGLAAFVVVQSHGFVTELRDQQLEWAFLERTVPRLPEQGTLLSVSNIGGRDLDAFPRFLLQRDKKTYGMVDLRSAFQGEVAWPKPGHDSLFYRGMFCYFALPGQPSPDPMTPFCRAVLERYVTEPLFVENLNTTGYSAMSYAPGPFRIGFYRLTGLR